MSEEILQVRQYGKTNKIIKDLKERNDKLTEQYRLRDIRCITLERENERLQQKVEQLEKENKELRQPQVFIDCEDMEERYGRDLHEDYLKGKIEQLENMKII